MNFIADFHIHSRFSRATSKTLDFEHLHIASQLKGISVVGTGDITHPGWLAEMVDKLVPAEPGLFRLKDAIRIRCDQQIPRSCHLNVRFILTAEISNIYKKNGKTRKNHNLIFLPDLEAVRRFNAALDKIGNICADGRPILGLDAKHLLDLLLEIDDRGFLVPAHIWTPWFSVLGSKSGFDTIEECFEDLSPQIFAVETGLSSDPPMNRRVSALDRFTLISNSDAHSPQKLGREANIFDTELSYAGIRSAIQSGDPQRFLGTVEFFPEEGKYHLDGHRNCSVRMKPQETARHQGICPQCNKPLTQGVLYRVEELADRPEPYWPQPHPAYTNLIPLTEIVSEILSVGAGSKRVQNAYQSLLKRFGPEFEILKTLRTEELEAGGIPLLGEAVKRMRTGRIVLSPGYDGVFGTIKIFEPQERDRLKGQKVLFAQKPTSNDGRRCRGKKCVDTEKWADIPPQVTESSPEPDFSESFLDSSSTDRLAPGRSDPLLNDLNPEQQQAVTHPAGPLIIVAGPGTGKTRALTHRIAFLITRRRVSPAMILAVTFTNKAAEEMRQRLNSLLGGSAVPSAVTTFHAFCLRVLAEPENQQSDLRFVALIDEVERIACMNRALKMVVQDEGPTHLPAREIFDAIAAAKQNLLSPQEIDTLRTNGRSDRTIASVYRYYQELLALQKSCDYEDLIFRTVRLFETRPEIRTAYRERFDHILVDEYQDLNFGQYRLLQLLAPPGRNLFVIGDPDQSIYGFRGSDARYFRRFMTENPGTAVITFKRNYRSVQTILTAAAHIITAALPASTATARVYSGFEGIKTVGVIETESERAEAVAVGKRIETLLGGVGFHSLDFDRIDGSEATQAFGFSDFAVLYRTRRQADILAETMQAAGIPCQIASKEHALNRKGMRLPIAWLKMIDGLASFQDLENLVSGLAIPLKRGALERFIGWAIQNRLDVTEALYRVQRFPLSTVHKKDQSRLAALSRDIKALATEFKSLGLRQKLKIVFDRLPGVFVEQHPGIADEYARLVTLATDDDLDLAAFFNRFALQTDADLHDSKSQKVYLMTMHAAKGLEFPVVFITGCEADLIPFKPPNGRLGDPAEERRLFYVAMTRAQKRLYLTYAGKRRVYGQTSPRKLSPFIDDIDIRLKQFESAGRRTGQKGSSRQVQLKLF